ncbi:TonB-dependent receptor [Dyella telluris]|uniref:TonB-dependent receptor n=1 Tax=Dyella telluris TaxID=2763498 RepID=UPI001EE52B92|nr:TonB-dependent receptor plug domain-containing protein [Dyella telluris]
MAVAIAMGFGVSGYVHAQSTTGTISGQVPVAAGESVHIVGGSGFDRTVPVDKSGRYSITLPIGKYDVSLVRDGQTIQTKQGVTALAASAVAVDFASGEGSSNAKNLSGVTVVANAIPAIDVSSTTQSTVITQEQLKQLPLARNSAAIALLAPGVVPGATADGTGPTGEPLVSFGGSTVVENAYYINGFNTSDPISNSGGISLPYGAIAQQETLTNGYGPEYGRSTGGVISQLGASGTNQWKFGGAVFWQPEDLQGTPGNTYFSNPNVTPALAASNSAYANRTPGNLYDYRNDNTAWNTVYDVYLGGPLIKDKLFFFVAAEAARSATETVSRNVGAPHEYHNNFKDPKYYAKIDWNITDSNILSITGAKNTHEFYGDTYAYDYSTKKAGAFNAYQQSTKDTFNLGVANFTSYITDDLTLNAMYGKMKGTYASSQPGASSNPEILDSGDQNPAYCPTANCTNDQITNYSNNPNHQSMETNTRLSLTYKLGDHTLKAGIDNQTSKDIEDGSIPNGPGYYWDYGYMDPGNPVLGTDPNVSPYVAPSPNGYYVQKGIYITTATVRVSQRAQYISDDWQVTPNLLLKLGLRNDQFTNYNPDSEPYVRLTKPQWAPRLGFSWDIMGDSSMKLFGNAGRYYLALPTGVALREASASTYTGQYYTYTGIDANGIPTGLTPLQSYGLTQGLGVPVSGNYEYGQPLDPKTVSSTNLKASYQDSYVLGFQHQFSEFWAYGVTGTWSKMNNIIDDTAEGPYAICAAALAQNPGLANQQPVNAQAASMANCGNLLNVNGSILINPGKTNTYKITNVNGGYAYASVSPADMGFPQAYRHYYSLEMYLEHVWDGKWRAKFDYVWSKSYGTTEGPVQSNIGQASTSQSATEQWDFGQLMQYANSVQPNSRKHVFKAYGTYQFLPEWSLSGVVTLASGAPKTCLGLYGTDETDPVAYGNSYHWCGGQPTPIGTTGYTPWLHTIDLALEYRPEWAQKKLAFQLQVRNLLNEQKETAAYPSYGATGAPNVSYGAPYVAGYTTVESPRVVQLGVTYDW